MNDRWCFRTDGDGHNYLVPIGHVNLFKFLLEKGELQNDYGQFIETFDKLRCDTISQFSFENPKKDIWI